MTEDGTNGMCDEEDLHQKTGLSTGTITDDDELATNLSHVGRGGCCQI